MSGINGCTVSVLVGFALLGGSLATMTVPKAQHDELKQTFSDELANTYKGIVTERRNHYLQGLALGVVLALGASYYFSSQTKGQHVAMFMAIALFTGLVYYRLMPKTDYMLNHLKTEEQNKAWLRIYKSFQSRYLYGMILGALATYFVAKASC